MLRGEGQILGLEKARSDHLADLNPSDGGSCDMGELETLHGANYPHNEAAFLRKALK